MMDLITRVIRMAEYLPKDSTAEIMGKAVTRSAATAGMHHSDAIRARSSREFIRDLKLMQVQLNQTDFWLKLIENTNYFKVEKISALKSANSEIIRIIEKSIRTATENLKKLTAEKKEAKEKALAKAVKK